MMFPILFGTIAAMLFGLVSYRTYGLEVTLNSAWFNGVFWSLILTGGIVSLLDACNHCLPCKLKAVFSSNRVIDALCDHAPCGEI